MPIWLRLPQVKNGDLPVCAGIPSQQDCVGRLSGWVFQPFDTASGKSQKKDGAPFCFVQQRLGNESGLEEFVERKHQSYEADLLDKAFKQLRNVPPIHYRSSVVVKLEWGLARDCTFELPTALFATVKWSRRAL